MTQPKPHNVNNIDEKEKIQVEEGGKEEKIENFEKKDLWRSSKVKIKMSKKKMKMKMMRKKEKMKGK